MKNYNRYIIFCIVGIILVSILMIYSTYAYFTVDISGESKEIVLTTFDKNTTIIYNDTSNVSMVNAYTGDEIIKTFSVENTSNYDLYYDVLLENVVNNFETKEDLVYTLVSEKGANREVSIIPSKEESIASDILIEPHQKHEYTMTITFLNKDSDQSDNMNKTFSSNILVSGSKSINVGEKVYKNNTLLGKIIELSKNEDNNIKITNNSLEGKPVYYYYGNEVDNNLMFNNMCFKIIRTDENYGIRLLYNGLYEDGICSNDKSIITSSFNIKSNYNAYVGYMYGNASSNTYKNEHNNINNSNIKILLDTWYKDNFNNITNMSKTNIFCNNRKTSSFTLNGVLYSKNGYSNSNTGYYNIIDPIISYDCINKEDRFSKDNILSNNKLEYPVGLISVDEILYSGDNSYLYDTNYWTMTPAYFNGSNAYNYVVNKNKIEATKVTNEFGVRPIISLDKDVILVSGDGSIASPYMVK